MAIGDWDKREREYRLKHAILDDWQPLITRGQIGHDISAEIEFIDQALNKIECDRNGVSASEVWEARRIHSELKAWWHLNSSLIKDLRQYWIDRAQATEKLATDLAKEGLKYAIALHGATAVASFNIAASQTTSKFPQLITFNIFAASTGVIMLALAQIILINLLGSISGLLTSRLTRKTSWITLGAIARWVDSPRRRRLLALVDALIFGSIAWFAIYMLLNVLVLVNY